MYLRTSTSSTRHWEEMSMEQLKDLLDMPQNIISINKAQKKKIQLCSFRGILDP